MELEIGIESLLDRIGSEDLHDAAHQIWLAARGASSTEAQWLLLQLSAGMHFRAARRERREETDND